MKNNQKENMLKYCKGLRLFVIYLIVMYSLGSFKFLRNIFIVSNAAETSFKLEESGLIVVTKNKDGLENAFTVTQEIPEMLSVGSFGFKNLFIAHQALCIVLMMLPAIIIYWGIKRILDNIIENESPFSIYNIGWIRKLGCLMIYMSVIKDSFGGGLLYLAAGRSFRLSISMNDSKWLLLTIGIILLVFANVFDYGSYLQNEYDETI